MVNLTTFTAVSAPPSGFMSYETRNLIHVGLNLIQFPIMIMGVFTNIVNIIIFLKIGFKDSMTVCFFFLSCSDLACLLLILPVPFFTHFSWMLYQAWRVDGWALTLVHVYYYMFSYDLSQFITTFAAVQRCCCVAMPHRFKNTFTPVRSATGIVIICVLTLASYMPIFTSQSLSPVYDPAQNRSVFVVGIQPWWNKAMEINKVLNIIILSTVCQCTVIVCLIILTYHLRASSKFRQSMKTESKELKTKGAKSSGETTHVSIASQNKSNGDKTGQRASRSKEEQAILSTTCVSIIFVTCNMTKVMLAYASVIEPQLDSFARYANLYYVLHTSRNTFDFTNASINMFVYLKFNTRYRTIVQSHVDRIRSFFRLKNLPQSRSITNSHCGK